MASSLSTLEAAANRAKRQKTSHPAEYIRALASKHGVSAERTSLDELAENFARLSDAEVQPDEIADLVIALKRKGVLSAAEAADLYGNHLANGTA